jgi:hypothetical protein
MNRGVQIVGFFTITLYLTLMTKFYIWLNFLHIGSPLREGNCVLMF